jgi:hypothetical protein
VTSPRPTSSRTRSDIMCNTCSASMPRSGACRTAGQSEPQRFRCASIYRRTAWPGCGEMQPGSAASSNRVTRKRPWVQRPRSATTHSETERRFRQPGDLDAWVFEATRGLVPPRVSVRPHASLRDLQRTPGRRRLNLVGLGSMRMDEVEQSVPDELSSAIRPSTRHPGRLGYPVHHADSEGGSSSDPTSSDTDVEPWRSR